MKRFIQDAVLVGIGALYVLVVFAWVLLVLYVLVHFVIKYW